jgi:hypothetical protein
MITRKLILTGPLALLLLFGLGACASLDVKTEHDPTAEFSRFRTFAFAVRPVVEEIDPNNNVAVRDRIESALARELTAKEMRRVGTEQAPDLMVYYSVAVREKLKKAWRTGYGWGARYGGGGTTYPYDEGTLIVDLVDPVKQQLKWRATIGAHLEDTAAGNLDLADRGIAEAFKDYPPQYRLHKGTIEPTTKQ